MPLAGEVDGGTIFAESQQILASSLIRLLSREFIRFRHQRRARSLPVDMPTDRRMPTNLKARNPTRSSLN